MLSVNFCIEGDVVKGGEAEETREEERRIRSQPGRSGSTSNHSCLKNEDLTVEPEQYGNNPTRQSDDSVT